MMPINNHIEILRSALRIKMLKATWLVFLAVTIAVILVAIIWLTARVENSELKHVLRDRVEQNHKQSQYLELRKHLERTIPFVDSIESKYKTRLSQPDIMMKLGELARRHDLRIVSQYYSRTTNDENITSATTIELRISGRYTDIRKMLSMLPTMPVWVEVSEIGLERQIGTHSTVSAQIKLVVLTEHIR